MAAIIKGHAPLDAVDPQEVSKTGRLILQSVQSLAEGGARPPYGLTPLALTASEVYGAEKGTIVPYLRGIKDVVVESDVSDIVAKVRDKQLLVEVVNAAAAQLQKGSLDVGELSALLASRPTTSAITSVSDLLRDGFPSPPQGLGFGSLPLLHRATGGIYGVWAIGGPPKVGKSTLAWQIGLDIARGIPVLYYDYENGFAVMMEHTRQIFNDNLEKVRAATEKLYYRDSIRTLDSDLAAVPAPALIVIDSIQKLPASMEYRRSGLDRWVHRMEMLKKRGYHVLMISEVGRMHYEEASISGFKETGEIEYSADTGLQLVNGTSGSVELHVVANRHRKFRGFLEHVVRQPAWWFREVAPVTETEPDSRVTAVAED